MGTLIFVSDICRDNKSLLRTVEAQLSETRFSKNF